MGDLIDNINRVHNEMCPKIDDECGAELKGIICLDLKHKDCIFFTSCNHESHFISTMTRCERCDGKEGN